MSVSSRCAVAVHALAYLARWDDDGPVSSAQVAESLESNPVLVRRILGQLRDAGLTDSTEGRGGGWRLARPADAITLNDAYGAVEEGPTIPAHPHPPSRSCVIGRHAQSLLEAEFCEAEQAMRARLDRTSIADMLDRIMERERARTGSGRP
ncbi:RrF2 family transcriptional regulator [Nocardiopsis composta]|uniref:Rrf2 family protein n=1 Tax=Nocardiopsis composta TaxID=157465 RepID=A0A7W8VEP4_9ACTN|nr:Rrf2 family transcriptional regulator [Nocardiopsis composta]MBB5433300.1 Rrf2 family protein [Nocardiopsis composta]